MAGAGEDKWQADNALIKRFKAYAGDKPFSSIANKKVVDALKKKFPPSDVTAACEASSFPAVADTKTKSLDLTVVKVTDYITRISKELVEKHNKKEKVPAKQWKMEETRVEVVACIMDYLPKATVKSSATGGVDRLTDTSKYTGAHKERFNKDGTGKGKEGRVTTVDDSGYVGNYKGKDTFDSSH